MSGLKANVEHTASDPRQVLKVLLVLPYAPAAFMQADADILDRYFDLEVVVHNRGKLRLGLSVLSRLLFRRPDVLLMWFVVPSYALALTLLARLFGAKPVFVTGGYDVVGMRSIGFGAMRVPLFRVLLKPTLLMADLVLPFSQSAARHLRRYVRPRNCHVVYPGVNTEFFTPGNAETREKMALTVSPVTEISILQKGLKTFVEAARYAPEMRWVLVGRSPDGSIQHLRRIAPDNVEFVERYIPAEELRALYRRASCYIQASVHEGFGIAVAEAMACGAVPVVTKRFSLPEVTGGLGEYIPLNDPQSTAAAALRSTEASSQVRANLQNQIAQNFSQVRRERALVRLLLEMWPARRRLGEGADLEVPVKLDLGCGSIMRPGFIGIDARLTKATSIVADVQALPVATRMVDEVHATCLLEHFDEPARVLGEVHRVLKSSGRAVFRLPNLGTYSAHLDITHRFLADLALWRGLFEGYFGSVEVRPIGTKYRDQRILLGINWLMVNLLKWYELAQGWDFVCTEPRSEPVLSYVGWWEESRHSGRIGGQLRSIEE